MAGASPTGPVPSGRSRNPVLRTVDLLTQAAAAIAAALIACIFLSVIFDVAARYAMTRPPAWPVPVSEYALHIAVCLGAPFVLQRKGHVVVDILAKALPAALRGPTTRLAMLASAAACLFLAFLASRAAVLAWLGNHLDIRSIVLPQWVLFVPMALAFLLMSVEFLRCAWAGEGAGRHETTDI